MVSECDSSSLTLLLVIYDAHHRLPSKARSAGTFLKVHALERKDANHVNEYNPTPPTQIVSEDMTDNILAVLISDALIARKTNVM